MRRLALLGLMGSAALGIASDHNNVDAGRPLRFDDAYSIAYRERALEIGLAFESFRKRGPGYGLKAEYKVGFAKNQDFGIGFEPTYRSDSRESDFGNVELSYFHGVRREIGNQAALGYRVEMELPTGKGAKGIHASLRGIATKALGQYDKLHLNLDVGYASEAERGERDIALGAILGYSVPLGYPRRFDQTLLAEVGWRQSESKGGQDVGTVGLGMRRQVGVRSVLDYGIESDFAGSRDARSPFRFAIGFSTAF